jgi:hypothetical protein
VERSTLAGAMAHAKLTQSRAPVRRKSGTQRGQRAFSRNKRTPKTGIAALPDPHRDVRPFRSRPRHLPNS